MSTPTPFDAERIVRYRLLGYSIPRLCELLAVPEHYTRLFLKRRGLA